MRRFPVEYSQEARADLNAIFEYVLDRSRDVATAIGYTDRLFEKCERIGDAPHGYPVRNDLSYGIRLVPFENSAVILYILENETVVVTNIFAGGRDYDAIMGQE